MNSERVRNAMLWVSGFIGGLALAFLVQKADASQVVAIGQNKSGGQMIFTDMPCNNDSYVVITYTPQSFVTGCWMFTKNESVAVLWEDGDVTEYPLKMFRPEEQKPEWRS